jgi:hypothetical protein
MFGLFKKDPVAKLQKQHRHLLAESFRLSKIDRKKSDELMAQADAIEQEIAKLSKP